MNRPNTISGQIVYFLKTAKPHQLPPTLGELAEYCGVHLTTVYYHLLELEDRGLIVRPRKAGTSRNIYLRR